MKFNMTLAAASVMALVAAAPAGAGGRSDADAGWRMAQVFDRIEKRNPGGVFDQQKIDPNSPYARREPGNRQQQPVADPPQVENKNDRRRGGEQERGVDRKDEKGRGDGERRWSGREPATSTIDAIKVKRKERREDGGKRVVIEEPDKRVIFQQNNRVFIDRDENERLRRFAPNARVERGARGSNVAVVERGGVKIYSETDERGRLIRRYRRDGAGRETVIIDNRRRDRDRDRGGDIAKGVAIGAGVVAGAVLLDSLVRVPPPRVTIAREKYVVRGEFATDDDYYEALSAPPVERFDDRYTLDEIRSTSRLRDRMRRIDLDDINFAFGAWDLDPSQYRKLERLARAMKRVLRRDPDEVFLIEGHTDAVGSRVDNLTLSDRRAETVAYILTREFDVPFEALVTQGYGEEYLKIQTEAPERTNRRVAVRRITPLLDREGGPVAARDRDPPDDDRYDDRYDRRDDRDDDRDYPSDRYDERYDGPPRRY